MTDPMPKMTEEHLIALEAACSTGMLRPESREFVPDLLANIRAQVHGTHVLVAVPGGEP